MNSPPQKASNAENVSIWWRHHVTPNTPIIPKLAHGVALFWFICAVPITSFNLCTYPYCSGVGVTKLISYIPLFSEFFSIVKTHDSCWISRSCYIWQVSPQLSCGDTCQIWTWFMEYNGCFYKIDIFPFGEKSTNGALVTPPRTVSYDFPSSCAEDFDNFWCSHWQKFCQHDNIFVSVHGLASSCNRTRKITNSMCTEHIEVDTKWPLCRPNF